MILLVVIPTFVVLFVTFWCSIVWLVSRMGHWHRLALRYRDQRSSGGRRYQRIAFAKVGFANYRFTLGLEMTETGFSVEVSWPFRSGHPRLFIPWSEVSAVKAIRLPWFRAVRLTIGEPSVGTISLPLSTLSENPHFRRAFPDVNES